jgi:serine/threonine protein kinase
MSDAFPCPSLETLRQFLVDSVASDASSSPSQGTKIPTPTDASVSVGDSTDWDARALELHVDGCEHCQRKLESLVVSLTAPEDSSDHWAVLPQQLPTGSNLASPSPALAALMQRVGEQLPRTQLVGNTSEHPSLESVPLDFLAPSDTPGVLGRLAAYDILEVVGRGGMGIVFKAYDTSLRRVVAIKVMAPHLASSVAARRRFVREARAAAAVSHEHVVAIHAVEEQHDPPFLVMQFIGGRTLHQRLNATGPLALPEILRIGAQTAAGLAAAHAQGLVHRDIKPANILLENGVERVKITDFGLARAVDDVELTQTGVVAGTPQFMAPEQANGEPIDHRTDLFSLGSVLYTLCAGRPPFRSTTTLGMLKRVCEETPRSIREFQPELPEWLDTVIFKLMAKRPEERYQSAAEVAVLLEQWLAHIQNPVVAARPAAPQVDSSHGNLPSTAPATPIASPRTTESPDSPERSQASSVGPTLSSSRFDWRSISRAFFTPFQQNKRLSDVYSGPAQWLLVFVWGTFMIPWIASNTTSLRFLEIAATFLVSAGVFLPLVILGISGWQFRRTRDWGRTLLRAPPIRLLWFPTLAPFALSVVYWGYRHTTTGVIEFDIDDPQFAVTIMGPGIPQARSFAANFYPLRVAPGVYSWHVMTGGGSSPIQAGQLKVEPQRRSSIIVRSPHPLGQAELAYLPGRWELKNFGEVNRMPQVVPVDEQAPIEFIDVTEGMDMVVYSDRLSKLWSEWSATRGEAAPQPTPTTQANTRFRLVATRPSTTVRSWMMVDVLTTGANPQVVARGILSADQHRLNLRLAPPNSPRVDSWGDSPTTADARSLSFERPSDLTLFQGEWVLEGDHPMNSPPNSRPVLEVVQRTLRWVAQTGQTAGVDATLTKWHKAFGADVPDPVEWKLQLDPTSKPKRATLTTHIKSSSPRATRIVEVECLYEVNGKSMTLAVGEPGVIPSSLDPDASGAYRVLRFRRVPK